MQIVIDIPIGTYKATCNGNMLPPDVAYVIEAIKNGTPLPEGHGRLIDADKLELDDGYSNYDGYYHKYSRSQICNAPTVLEADEKKQRNRVEFVCDIFDEMNRDDRIKVWQYVNEIMEGE